MWALANFDVVGYLESQTEGRSELPGEELAMHIVEAVNGTSLWQCRGMMYLSFRQASSSRYRYGTSTHCKTLFVC